MKPIYIVTCVILLCMENHSMNSSTRKPFFCFKLQFSMYLIQYEKKFNFHKWQILLHNILFSTSKWYSLFGQRKINMRKISSSKEINGKIEFSVFDSLSKNRFVSMKKMCYWPLSIKFQKSWYSSWIKSDIWRFISQANWFIWQLQSINLDWKRNVLHEIHNY